MKKICLFFIIVIFSEGALASTVLESKNFTPPKKCLNLTCVRNNIDQIDADIVKLIGLRLTYVKRSGELKGKQLIHDQKRENQILQKVSQMASKEGYPGTIAVEVYKTLLAQANIYEQQVQTKK